jgi:hypothetical protein
LDWIGLSILNVQADRNAESDQILENNLEFDPKKSDRSEA